MDLQLTGEQKLISEAAREFADREIAPFGVAMATEDRVEAMQAFLEQRQPDFHGR